MDAQNNRSVLMGCRDDLVSKMDLIKASMSALEQVRHVHIALIPLVIFKLLMKSMTYIYIVGRQIELVKTIPGTCRVVT